MNRKYYLISTLLLVVAILITSHVYVNRQGVSYSGFLLIIEHFYNFFLAISLLFICTLSWVFFIIPLEKFIR